MTFCLARPNDWTVIVAALAVVTIVVSCEHPVTDPSSSIAQLVVSPQNVTLQQNQAEDFLAVGFTATGDSADIAVSWGATGGSIDSSSAGKRHYGHYTSATCGAFTVTATSHPGNVSTAASVTVTGCPLPVASVSVTPATATIGVGQTAQYAAITRDAFGNPLGGRTVTWSSSNPAVATVNGAGQATGVAVGAATLTATSEGKGGRAAITVTTVPVASVTVSRGTATITVSTVPVASVTVSPSTASVPVGQTVQLTATPKDASGNPLSGRPVSWGSSNTAVATVSGSGVVTGVTAGAATITATSEGQSGTTTITVSTVPVASVTVSPSTASVQVGQTVQLTATSKDASGNPLSGRPVSWGSSDRAAARESAGRVVAGVTAGAATITATSEGQSGTATVTVSTVPVASVTVSPSTASVQVGQTVQLTATPKDASGNPLSGRTVSWGSSNTAVATVTASGLVTGKAAGTATITATSEGKSGPSTITVTPVPVASVTITPATATIQTGQTVQLTATPKDANGNPLTGRTVTWASSAASVASVNATGLVTGIVVGMATITATSEGQNATAAITVTAPASGGTPDPTVLLVATTAQVPLTTAYDALNVPALAAGGWYLDPTTGVKIYKLTSGTFPTSSPNWGHDYSEGGDEVSLPYNGNTRAVLVRQNGGAWWLVDFTPGGGVGNGRQLAGRLAPCFDQSFSFSNNPATPYYAYVSDCSAIIRFDIRTMTEAPGNGWPISESNACWLQQSENDGLFTWLRGQSGPTVAAFEPATNTLKTYTNSGVNEPRIDRAGRYIGLSMNSPPEALFVWDFTTNNIIWQTSGDPGIPFSHNASLRRRWLVVDWNSSSPHQYAMFTPDVPNSGQYIGGPANANDFYGNGNWIQHPADLNDQWAVFSTMEGLQSSGSGWLAPGGMVLITPNGQRRLLGHPYNTGTNYTFYSFVRFAPDGRYVLFTSDMDGSGRNDVFLAELPIR